MITDLHDNQIALRNSRDKVRKCSNPEILRAVRDQNFLVGKYAHQVFRKAQTRQTENRRNDSAQAQCHTENIIHRAGIPFSSVLGPENAKSRHRRAQEHVLNELKLRCQRHR